MPLIRRGCVFHIIGDKFSLTQDLPNTVWEVPVFPKCVFGNILSQLKLYISKEKNDKTKGRCVVDPKYCTFCHWKFVLFLHIIVLCCFLLLWQVGRCFSNMLTSIKAIKWIGLVNSSLSGETEPYIIHDLKIMIHSNLS